jgi:hypothetical protein
MGLHCWQEREHTKEEVKAQLLNPLNSGWVSTIRIVLFMYANTLRCDYVPPARTEVKKDVRRKYEGLEPLRSVDN